QEFANHKEHSTAKPQPEATESLPDRIIEDCPPSLSLCMILSRHDSVCLAQELGKESPGWPIKCLALPRKLLPVSRGRFITPRQPAIKAVGAARYSRFVTCCPWPRSGCPVLVARGPSGSTKKPARTLPADCLKLEQGSGRG